MPIDYFGQKPEDFDPNESYKRKDYSKDNPNDEWDFEQRENLESNLSYKSDYTLNLRKNHAK